MIPVLITLAGLAGLVWLLLPHFAGGIGLDMMLVYLGMAVIGACLRLVNGRGRS